MPSEHEREHEAEQAALRAALDLPGPWPSTTTARTRSVEVLDVDRYDGLGVVLAAVERLDLGLFLLASVFRREEAWRPMFGGGSTSGEMDPILERQRIGPATFILRRGGGRHRARPHEHGPDVCYAEVICSGAVASVVVDRPSHRRVAAVTVGPGWISIVWPEGPEPRVTALGPAGEELDYLDPGLFRDG